MYKAKFKCLVRTFKGSIIVSFLHCHLLCRTSFFPDAMALSVPPPSHTPWDRTLPNPAALMPTGAEVRRSSSLLQHHISSDQFTTPAADETGRGKHLPCIPPLNVLGKDRARAVDEEDGKQRQGSNISEDSMTDISSEDLSPVGNPTGYCLCVPEPKIPRPRNGEFDPPNIRFRRALTCPSVHLVSSASPRRSRITTPRIAESGHFQDYWRTMETTFAQGQE